MPRKQKLGSKFQNDGVFWSPANPSDTFPGKVSNEGKHIQLISSAVFQDVDSSQMSEIFAGVNSSLAAPVQVLWGIVDGAPCTLFGLQQLLDGGFTDFGRMQAVTYRQFRVGLCVLGLHLEARDAASVASARVTYTALKYWHRPQRDTTMNADSISFIFPRNAPPLIDCSSGDGRVGYTFDIEPQIRQERGELRVLNEAAVRITPSEPQSVSWFFERAYRIQGYFALILGSSLQIRSLLLKTADEIGTCRRKERGVTEEVRYQITVKPTPTELAQSLILWTDLPSSFNTLEGLLFAIREEKVSTETGFLSVAKALEGFERLTHTWATNSKITFRMRIEELLSRISPELTRKTIGDPVAFEAKLRTTRDYLTHPGLPLKPEVITDTHDLFIFRMHCEVFLRLLILRFIGLSETSLAEPMYQHSHLWS